MIWLWYEWMNVWSVAGGCLQDHTAYQVSSLLSHFYLPLVFFVYHYVIHFFLICHNKTVHMHFGSFVRPLMGNVIAFWISFRVHETLSLAQAEEEITEIGIDSSSLLGFCLNQACENHHNCQETMNTTFRNHVLGWTRVLQSGHHCTLLSPLWSAGDDSHNLRTWTMSYRVFNKGNLSYFRRTFLMLNYIDVTKIDAYIWSWAVKRDNGERRSKEPELLYILLITKCILILVGRDFPPIQTSPGAHPASCTMGNLSFPGVKYSRGVLLTTHPFLVPRSWKSRAIPLPTLWPTTGPVPGILNLDCTKCILKLQGICMFCHVNACT